MPQRKYLVQIPVLVYADYEVEAENEKQAKHIAHHTYENETDRQVLSRVVDDIETGDLYSYNIEEVNV